MSDSRTAVFLSYASQDATAAAEIARALRAGGIEVWFDQSELRGGDAWDASIRRQIKACSLFIPVISKITQDLAAQDESRAGSDCSGDVISNYAAFPCTIAVEGGDCPSAKLLNLASATSIETSKGSGTF
jgi:TIR domain